MKRHSDATRGGRHEEMNKSREASLGFAGQVVIMLSKEDYVRLENFRASFPSMRVFEAKD